MFGKAENLIRPTWGFSGLFEPGMFGSELDLCEKVVILTLYGRPYRYGRQDGQKSS